VSQYHSINSGETERFFTVVARASGAPVTAGTVNYYLRAKSGANNGKWWRDSDQTWQVAETANAMTHNADGHWEIDLTTSPFTDGVRYLEYVKESGDLHVPDGRHLVAVDVGTDVWSAAERTLTQSAAQVAAIVAGSKITIHRGDYTSIALTGLGSVIGRTGEKIYFTVKTTPSNNLTDGDAVLQVTELTGAYWLNSATIAAPVVVGDASISVTDESAGNLTIVLKSAITTLLPAASGYYYDIQWIDSAGEPRTLTSGRLDVDEDITRRQN
jgi:hypothetical protein